ncbi:hypothetical protein JHW43_006116 [Diplocarpon mali]|nr:hypothetical protein JHW43_006116 [Diplocarpon mali]
MGHETTGEVSQVGSAVQNQQVGDTVVIPFTVSCGECFYCQRGYSSRCEKSRQLTLDLGIQPFADAKAVAAPPGIDERKLVRLADIFPTGYLAAQNAFEGFGADTVHQSAVVRIGCGPVGLCALMNALEHQPKAGLAVDRPILLVWLEARVKELTDGRGADAVIEGIGHADAFRTAFDLLRPWGNISRFGVHIEAIPSIPGSVGAAAKHQDKLEQVLFSSRARCWGGSVSLLPGIQNQYRSPTTDPFMPLSQAVEGREIFDQMQVRKVVFVPEHAWVGDAAGWWWCCGWREEGGGG